MKLSCLSLPGDLSESENLSKMAGDDEFDLVIIGGGPGGLAPLLAAHRSGHLKALLAKGVAVVEQTDRLGSGSIGDYAINSDGSGKTFVDCLQANEPSELTRLAEHPVTQAISAAGDGPIPLHDAGRFLGLVGDALGRILDDWPSSAVLTRHKALSATQTWNGWAIDVLDLTTGQIRKVKTRNLVTATGAHQPLDRLAEEKIGGLLLGEACGSRLMQSGDVLKEEGLTRLSALLSGRDTPRVVIVGGSTSAAAVAHALLYRLPDVKFDAGGVSLLHRRALNIFYADRQAALDEGYTEWTEADVCPISGRVFRFGGFRLDSRELIMQARGIGGRPPEPRLHLHRLSANDKDAERIINTADVVIAALGYRPRALSLRDRNDQPIALLAHTGPQMPLVDGDCRVLGADHVPVANLFSIGLASGFVPSGPLGGEPSFRGQANGLWLWQHDVGSLIVKAAMVEDPVMLEDTLAEFDAPCSPAAVPLAEQQPAFVGAI